MQGDTSNTVVVGNEFSHGNDTRDEYEEDSESERYFDIKKEPIGTTTSTDNTIKDTLDNETNKNLSTFLDHLIASHGGNDGETESCAQSAHQHEKNVAILDSSEQNEDKHESPEGTSHSGAITSDQKAQVDFFKS